MSHPIAKRKRESGEAKLRAEGGIDSTKEMGVPVRSNRQAADSLGLSGIPVPGNQ